MIGLGVRENIAGILWSDTKNMTWDVGKSRLGTTETGDTNVPESEWITEQLADAKETELRCTGVSEKTYNKNSECESESGGLVAPTVQETVYVADRDARIRSWETQGGKPREMKEYLLVMRMRGCTRERGDEK